MARAYSLDLRERVMHALDAGLSPREIERSFGISVRTSLRWQAAREAGGDLIPATSPGRPPKLTDAHRAALSDQVRAEPDLTLADLVVWVREQGGVSVSTATLSRALHALGFTRKKRP